MAVSRFNPDYPDAGLRQLVPTSIAVGSGSASFNGNGSVDFSGATSVSLNGVFSSLYDNYRITGIFTGGNGAAVVGLRVRSGTTDNSSNNYIYAGHETYTNVGPSRIASTSASFFRFIYQDPNETGNFCLDLFDPFRTQFTGYISKSMRRVSSSNLGFEHSSGTMTVNTSYDGFTLIGGGGTITGSIQVYGYRK